MKGDDKWLSVQLAKPLFSLSPTFRGLQKCLCKQEFYFSNSFNHCFSYHSQKTTYLRLWCTANHSKRLQHITINSKWAQKSLTSVYIIFVRKVPSLQIKPLVPLYKM